MLDLARCPEFLKPRLRIYLSADIIGSTAQKQSKLGALEPNGQPNDPSWFTTIQGFYFEAQQSVREAWDGLADDLGEGHHLGEVPTLWKTVGDEVLFTKLVSDHRQVLATVRCWMTALNGMREFLRREGNGRLGVKSTVWLAEFPIRNKEVVLSGDSFSQSGPIGDYFAENGRILNDFYSGKSDKINIDYIGPSIDTGFRLTTQASARKLIISVEVAYILAMAPRLANQIVVPVDMRYDGEIHLKGVMGGAGYPLFWIDLSVEDSAAVLGDRLSGQGKCDRDLVSDFCRAFFQEKEDFISPPFIISDEEKVLTHTPEWYEERLQNLIKWFENPQDEAAEIEVAEKAASSSAALGDPNFQENWQAFRDRLDRLALAAHKSFEGGSAVVNQSPDLE